MNWTLRKIYGNIFVTSFPDGTEVPWKPLSFGDFIYFIEAISEGRIPLAILHDEIFRKTVANPVLVENLDNLPAGIITAIAEDALAVSGPQQPDLFNADMEAARQRAGLYVHQLIPIVCRAFPAYTPEDVAALPYEVVLLRLAQAEQILQLPQKIEMFDSKSPKKRRVPQEIKQLFEKQNSPEQTEKAVKQKKAWERVNKASIPEGLDTKPKPVEPDSPLLKKHGKIDFAKENKELLVAGGVGGWDKRDAPMIQRQMIDNARKIYPHLFKEGEKKK